MDKYIIDANVVLLAGTAVKDIPKEQLVCARKCVNFIRDFMKTPQARLVLDTEGRVLREYRGVNTVGTGRNLGTEFCIWAYQNAGRYAEDFVHLDELEEHVFKEYPEDQRLQKFDPPDRKYIALAYKHPQRPPIVEASDSKWWGIRQALKEHGMHVQFIDEDYIKNKYMQKIET